MEYLGQLFTRSNVFDQRLQAGMLTNHRFIQRKFITLLRNEGDAFVEYIDRKKSNNFTTLQKITLVHFIYIHTSQFTDKFEQLNLRHGGDDVWLVRNVFVPYQNFIRKIISSSQLFERVRTLNNGWNNYLPPDPNLQAKTAIRTNPELYFNLELMYYIINCLKDMFSFLKKISNLGRYYLRNHHQEMTSFIRIASYQMVLLYFALKFIINEVIFKYRNYIHGLDEDLAFKDILTIQLEGINEHMKTILLNKYFPILQMGIKINLFELDKQSEENMVLLENIFGHQEYTRVGRGNNCKKNMQLLGKSIFMDGGFNQDLFQQSISQMDFEDLCQQSLDHVLTVKGNMRMERFGQQKLEEDDLASKLTVSQQTIESETHIQ